MVKGFLSQRGIAYEERDVSRSQAYAQELVRSTQQMGVPVTVFDGQTIIGFDRGRLEQLVGSIQANQRPSFGASIADAASITARQGAEVIRGAYVGRTRPGSTAQKIGLRSDSGKPASLFRSFDSRCRQHYRETRSGSNTRRLCRQDETRLYRPENRSHFRRHHYPVEHDKHRERGGF